MTLHDYCPEMPTAFDDEGNPVPVAHPVYQDEPAGPPDWLREERLNTIRRFLEALAEHGTALEAGQHVIALAWLCNVREFKSQRAFARYLGTTEARASQIVARLNTLFPGMGHLKRRQKQNGA